jgi:CRISPR-associated protein Cas2
MMVLVTYDVNVETLEGRRRLRHIANECKDYGRRVQNSVFECLVDPAQWAELKKTLEDEIEPATDSLRYYYLGANWKKRIEHVGAKPSYDPEGLLMV